MSSCLPIVANATSRNGFRTHHRIHIGMPVWIVQRTTHSSLKHVHTSRLLPFAAYYWRALGTEKASLRPILFDGQPGLQRPPLPSSTTPKALLPSSTRRLPSSTSSTNVFSYTTRFLVKCPRRLPSSSTSLINYPTLHDFTILDGLAQLRHILPATLATTYLDYLNSPSHPIDYRSSSTTCTFHPRLRSSLDYPPSSTTCAVMGCGTSCRLVDL
jgi:hypothetical protein